MGFTRRNLAISVSSYIIGCNLFLQDNYYFWSENNTMSIKNLEHIYM